MNKEWVFATLNHQEGWLRTTDGSAALKPAITEYYSNWQQYTGLKDKNGKEIYQADLFNCIYRRDGCTDHRYQVLWGETSAGFVLQRIGKPCPQVQVHQKLSDVARSEVIGNIYENSELLTN